jgi:hypothetical protein
LLNSSAFIFKPFAGEFGSFYASIKYFATSGQSISNNGSIVVRRSPTPHLINQFHVVGLNTLSFAGVSGFAMAFDGIDDTIVTRLTDFPQGSFTISLWLRNIRCKNPLSSLTPIQATPAADRL